MQLCFPLIVTPIPKRRGLLSFGLFHVLAQDRTSGSGKRALCAPEPRRRGTLREKKKQNKKRGADDDALMVPISSRSSLFTRRLWSPDEGRCDLFEVRVEVYIYFSGRFTETTPALCLSCNPFDHIISCFYCFSSPYSQP